MKMGMIACSDTSITTVNACMKLFLIYNNGIDIISNIMGMCFRMVPGNFAGMGVSLYHVSASTHGRQKIPFIFGPNAIHLETSHDQILADMTNKNRIGLCKL